MSGYTFTSLGIEIADVPNWKFRPHGRTPLFAAVCRALRSALADRFQSHGQCAYANSRREFIKHTAATAAWLSVGAPLLPACGRRGSRVAIVGAGLAGLNAAYVLRKAGIAATVYEASERIGGRVHTVRDKIGPGIYTELGGEFIDSDHADMLALAKEFGLQLLDRKSPDVASLKTSYFFGGKHYSEAQVVDAFKPIAARIAADADAIGETIDYKSADDAARILDAMSLAQYLSSIDAKGWVRDLLEVAYVTEFGLDAEQQSALNLVTLIGTDLSSGEFAVFGDSDERYVIKGGNDQIVQALAQRVAGQVHLTHALEAIRRTESGYRLEFRNETPERLNVLADVVILALPFSVLRRIELDVPLPDVKRKAIAELGYGTNAKVFAGFKRRAWRATNHNGEMFTDEPLQLCWDHTLLQPGAAGGMTFFLGGRPGMEVGHDDPERQVNRLIVGLERAFPGVRDAREENSFRFHWPTYPYTRGSYACYTVGQWTSIGGAEFEPVEQLYFAGEHCSADFQGYMNGAAETGRRAAEAIIATYADKT